MKSFSADISAWVAKAKANADAVVRQSVQDMAYRITATSPVDTGYFRASWWASLNGPGEHPQQPVKVAGRLAAAGGLGTAAEMAAVISQGKAGDRFYLLNNAAYAVTLEYGHSQQAPAGIVRPVVAAAPHIVADNIAKYGRR